MAIIVMLKTLCVEDAVSLLWRSVFIQFKIYHVRQILEVLLYYARQ